MSEVKKGSFLQPVEREAPASPLQSFPYSTVLQSKAVHGIVSGATTRGMKIDKAATPPHGTIQSEGVTITIDALPAPIETEGSKPTINLPNISSQDSKAFILLLEKVTKQLPRDDAITADAIDKGRTVRITLEEFMERCNIKDIKNAREQLNDGIRTLYSRSIEFDEEVYEKPEGRKRAIKVKKHHSMRITDHTITQNEGKPIRRGVAEFRFSFDMAKYLCNAYIMPYPNALLSINTKLHPYSIPLGWKLSALYNMNFGKRTQNTTTVKTLLSAVPDIPRYEDIAAKGGVTRKIIEPFDRDLAAFVEAGVLLPYWYIDKDGNRIDPFDENGNRISPSPLGGLSYAEFASLSIHFEMKDYPDQTPRLEARNKKISASINRNRKKAKGEAKQ